MAFSYYEHFIPSNSRYQHLAILWIRYLVLSVLVSPSLSAQKYYNATYPGRQDEPPTVLMYTTM
jgi:hypothetical protein